MRAKGMAGTRQAAMLCDNCDHARIRHYSTPTTGCSHLGHPDFTMKSGRKTFTTTRCTCPGFTARKAT